MVTAPIRIVTALILDEHGHLLLVRKRGTQAFMLPGGKLDPGELPLAALAREVSEELGCTLAGGAKPLGTFSAPAANEAGRIVEAQIYHARLIGAATAQAEIDALVWIDPAAPGDTVLAPLACTYVLPLATALYAR